METQPGHLFSRGALNIWFERMVSRMPVLESTGSQLSRSIHDFVLRGGTSTRTIADFLHGTWMGHPLHAILTDFTIGAWSLGVLLDAVSIIRGSKDVERAADTLIATGTAMAVPTILAGLTDFSTIKKPAVPTAVLHALLNDVNFTLFMLSSRQRRHGKRKSGVLLSLIGVKLLLVSAWLGGHLVYSHRVGVNHNQHLTGFDDWTDAMADDMLPEGELRAVEVEGQKVLLFRCNGRVLAIDAVCSHAGGPLEEGHTHENCVVHCPWHDSEFDLRTGEVVHGPATQPQAAFVTRIENGRIQVRLLHQVAAGSSEE